MGLLALFLESFHVLDFSSFFHCFLMYFGEVSEAKMAPQIEFFRGLEGVYFEVSF